MEEVLVDNLELGLWEVTENEDESKDIVEQVPVLSINETSTNHHREHATRSANQKRSSQLSSNQ